MYREHNPYDSDHDDYVPYAQRQAPVGRGRHRAPAAEFVPPAGAFTVPPAPDPSSWPLMPPGADWDPGEELAFMLQDVGETEGERPVAHRVDEPPPFRSEDDPSVLTPAAGTPLGNLQQITEALPPLRRRRRTRRRDRTRRKVRRRPDIGPLRAASLVLAGLAAVIAASVSLLSGMAAYEPLRLTAAARASLGVVAWWPLLVYGPWLVASLSVLRAALHRRRAVHSWSVVLLFSAIAMLLCIVQAPRTLGGIAAAALPGLASLVCFQQVVRQITLSRPPRRAVPRHRQAAEARPVAATSASASSAATSASASSATTSGAVSGGGGGVSGTKGRAAPASAPHPRPSEPRSRVTAPKRERTVGATGSDRGHPPLTPVR